MSAAQGIWSRSAQPAAGAVLPPWPSPRPRLRRGGRCRGLQAQGVCLVRVPLIARSAWSDRIITQPGFCGTKRNPFPSTPPQVHWLVPPYPADRAALLGSPHLRVSSWKLPPSAHRSLACAPTPGDIRAPFCTETSGGVGRAARPPCPRPVCGKVAFAQFRNSLRRGISRRKSAIYCGRPPGSRPACPAPADRIAASGAARCPAGCTDAPGNRSLLRRGRVASSPHHRAASPSFLLLVTTVSSLVNWWMDPLTTGATSTSRELLPPQVPTQP